MLYKSKEIYACASNIILVFIIITGDCLMFSYKQAFFTDTTNFFGTMKVIAVKKVILSDVGVKDVL